MMDGEDGRGIDNDTTSGVITALENQYMEHDEWTRNWKVWKMRVVNSRGSEKNCYGDENLTFI